MPEVHEAVVQHFNDFTAMTSENVVLKAHVAALERDLALERGKTETLQEAIKCHVHSIDWYSRTMAGLLTNFRSAAQMMHDGFNQAVREARSHGMTDQISETMRITEAEKLTMNGSGAPIGPTGESEDTRG